MDAFCPKLRLSLPANQHMTEDLTITHETQPGYGRYVTRMQSGEEAEMTYVVRTPEIRDFNHTFVPNAFRGSGIAAKLMNRAIADARAEGFRIIPTCSYVAAQFRRHRDWSDLLADGLTPDTIGEGACSLPPPKQADEGNNS